MIVAGLRSLAKTAQQQAAKMPIQINLLENEVLGPLIRRTHREGVRKGELALLSRLIEKRFGSLPVFRQQETGGLVPIGARRCFRPPASCHKPERPAAITHSFTGPTSVMIRRPCVVWRSGGTGRRKCQVRSIFWKTRSLSRKSHREGVRKVSWPLMPADREAFWAAPSRKELLRLLSPSASAASNCTCGRQ